MTPSTPALQIEPLLATLSEHGVEFVIIGGFAPITSLERARRPGHA